MIEIEISTKDQLLTSFIRRLSYNNSSSKNGYRYVSIITFAVFIVLLASIFPINAFAEGTNELCANDTDETYLQLCNDFITHCEAGGDRTNFAVYGCDRPDRLNFVINSTDEVVYFGFNGNPNGFGNIVFRIKDMFGVVVYTETDIPTSGIGYINSVSETRIGPNQISGTSDGYDAFVIPDLPVGTYYIEFDIPNGTGSFYINYLDVTIFNEVTFTVETGRLYSEGWQFRESGGGGNWDRNSSKFYIYSSDSIVTSIQFNQMEGRAWLMFCNATGCASTGNFESDRKSLPYQQAYVPEYRIFLNEPDADKFPPTTTLGEITQPVTGTGNCIDGSVDFDVWVDKEGYCEIELVFDDPLYTTVKVTQSVIIDQNTLNWGGDDGSGTPVPNDVGITFVVTYINGLTNLPLYDIEHNINGFVIELISPAGPAPLVFWDDLDLSPPSANFTGSTSSQTPCVGCHTWNNFFGDYNTVNTWWYSASTTESPVVMQEKRRPATPVFEQTAPNFCEGTATSGEYFSVIPDLSTENYSWSYTGNDVTINQVNLSDNFITVDIGPDATAGNLTVHGTNTLCGIGETSFLIIGILDSVIIDAGNDGIINETEIFYTDPTVNTNYRNLLWTSSSGTGIFSNPNAVNPYYTPSAGDIASGSVMLYMYAESILPCTGVAFDSLTLTIISGPIVDAGNDTTICDNQVYEILTATAVNAISVQWTTLGDGTFDDDLILPTTYTPGTLDISNGFVTLTLTGYNGPDQASDDMVLTIQRSPIAVAGNSVTICEGETHTLDGTVSFQQSVLWVSSGDGTFSDATSLTAGYTPGSGDIGNETVDLTLTAFAISPCGVDDSDVVTLTILESLEVEAGTDATVCEGETYTLSGTAENEQTVLWITSGDGLFDFDNVLEPIYTPGTNDILTGSATLTLTAYSSLTCTADSSDNMILTIQRTPTAFAGLPATICEGETYTMSGDSTDALSILWSTSGDGSFDDAALVNAIYTPGSNDIGVGFYNYN